MNQEAEKKGLEKTQKDIDFMLSCYQEMLQEIPEPEIVKFITDPVQKELSTHLPDVAEEKLIHALSIYFQLINLVEENAATQFRRYLENQYGIDRIRGSWGETFQLWKKQGLKEEDMLEIFPHLNIMPVLTAHPTEAKRVTVLEIHRELYLLLVKNENTSWSNSEKEAIRDQIKALLERWWYTGELYLEKPDLAAERDNVLYYFTQVFPRALQQSDQRLKNSWKAMGFDPEKLSQPEQFPQLNFGSWVGGDRDGHPFVRAEVTRETLLLHRQAAFSVLQSQLVELAAKMTISDNYIQVPEQLRNAIQEKLAALGEKGTRAQARNPRESFRQYVNLLLVRLQNTQEGLNDHPEKYYLSPQVLKEDLRVLRSALLEIGAQSVAEDLLFTVERQVQCFGFHLAKLDIRQNSAFYDKALYLAFYGKK
ncbi:MAG: phosphoenolpyruvate carboxylase [Bacteroidota bacterium]